MAENHSGTCPLCDVTTRHINNHVRMSNGDGHGPQGSYPENWDTDQHGLASGAESDGPERTGGNDLLNAQSGHGVYGGGEEVLDDAQGGRTVEATESDSAGSESTGTEPLEFADTPADMREYECGECGNPLDYLAESCDNCNAEPLWRYND